MEVNIYIRLWTLKMKCTRYGSCEEVALKNARAMGFFWKSSGTGKSFRAGLKNPGFFVRQLPLPESTSPKRLIGGRISSSQAIHLLELVISHNLSIHRQIYWIISQLHGWKIRTSSSTLVPLDEQSVVFIGYLCIIFTHPHNINDPKLISWIIW